MLVVIEGLEPEPVFVGFGSRKNAEAFIASLSPTPPGVTMRVAGVRQQATVVRLLDEARKAAA